MCTQGKTVQCRVDDEFMFSVQVFLSLVFCFWPDSFYFSGAFVPRWLHNMMGVSSHMHHTAVRK